MESTPPRKRKWRLRAPTRLELFAAVLLPILAAGGSYYLYRRHLRGELELRYRRIRAAGYPVTLEELDKWYRRPPAGANAADVYARAFAALVPAVDDADPAGVDSIPFRKDDDLPGIGAPYPEEAMERIGSYLAANEKALALLHEAAGMSACRYPVDFGKGPGRIPFVPLRRGSHLLNLEAVHHAVRGEPEPAGRSLLAQLALVRSLDEWPTMPPQLMRLGLLKTFLGNLERALALAPLPATTLEGLDGGLAGFTDDPLWLRGLAGDRCLTIRAFEARIAVQSMDHGEPGTEEPVFALIRFLGIRDWDLIRYLDGVEEIQDLAQVPYPRRLAVFADQMQRLEAEGRGHRLWILTQMLENYLLSLTRAASERVAQIRAARAALAVERFRAAEGRLPEGLAETAAPGAPPLPGDSLTDPFTGEPLRYRRLETGYIVYSVGPDRRDDGGGKSPDGEPGRDDIAFTVVR